MAAWVIIDPDNNYIRHFQEQSLLLPYIANKGY